MKKEEIMEILKEAIVSTHFVNKNNMKTKASIDKEQMESVDLTIEITMPVANWRVVKNAIEKGKDGYYGPAWDGGETAVYQVLTWSKEIQALQSFEKGKDGYYGPAWDVMKTITDAINRQTERIDVTEIKV